MIINSDVWVAFGFAGIVSLAVTYLTMMIYRGLGLVDRGSRSDHPKNIHTTPVPRGGGIGVFVAMLITILVLVGGGGQNIVILIGGGVILALGVLDDLFNISPYVRLGGGVIAAAIVVGSGLGITYVSNPLGGAPLTFEGIPWLGQALTILWITWAMNFVNMGAKGLDGQLPGVVIIAAGVMGVLSLKYASDPAAVNAAVMASAVAGSYLGLLAFNVYPQKIMPGWGGGALGGYLLAVVSILSGAKLATALIVLGVPLMDVVYAILRRIRQGKSPVWGDAEHLHHRLLALGWSKRQVAGAYWGVSLILGIIALQLNSQMKIYTILLIAGSVGGILLWINLFLSQKQQGLDSGSRM